MWHSMPHGLQRIDVTIYTYILRQEGRKHYNQLYNYNVDVEDNKRMATRFCFTMCLFLKSSEKNAVQPPVLQIKQSDVPFSQRPSNIASLQ